MKDKTLNYDILDDLQVQSMIFDMDIDYESLTLVPRNDYKEPDWLIRWKEKQDGSDRDNSRDYDQE